MAKPAGLFRPTTRWSALSLPSMSFGQEIGVTGMQIAMAAAAIANGGYLMKPIVVKRVEDAEGRVVKDAKPLVVRRVLQPETIDVLTDILRAVVSEGTGREAAVPGYVVAGKTGTAQKVDASGRYSMVDHVASFVGWVPVARPALVVLASLDTPRGARNQGGDVAAPLFARVAEGALRVLAVPPDDPGRVLRAVATAPETVVPAAYRPQAPPRPAALAPDDEPRLMPDLRGRSAREALAEEFVRLGLAINEYSPGYVDSYTGEPEWQQEAKRTGKIPLADLMKRVARLGEAISCESEMDVQRKDYLARHVTAMQMSLRLLSGESVSLTEEVNVLFDVQPQWKDETNFEEYQRELDQILPPGGSIRERDQRWKKSNEVSLEKVRELLPLITKKLRDLTRQKFGLPEDESFSVEFVGNKPWGANNAYQGGFRSLIQINTDLPNRIDFLPDLIAHEGYQIGVLRLAFRGYQLHKVCGQALGFNEASIRLHRSLGFREEGVLREQHFVDGRYHDVISFGLLQRERIDPA